MNSYPYCSHNLLRHLRSQNRYWYCPHCRKRNIRQLHNSPKYL